MSDLISTCCGKPLIWGLEREMVGAHGQPVGYSALCSGCRKWVGGIPMEAASGVQIAHASCFCGQPTDPTRIHTSDVPCYDRPTKPASPPAY